MNHRPILPAAAIGALLAISACSDPVNETGDTYDPAAEQAAPVENEPYETQDMPPPPSMDEPAMTDPAIVDPEAPETGEATATEPADPVAR